MPLKNRGTILVTLLVAAGLAAAIAAVWNQYSQTHRALKFWGAEVAQLIETATTVELIDLAARRARDTGGATDSPYPPPLDISRARGLIHFRRSLLEDANFDWTAKVDIVPDHEWDYAVLFLDNVDRVTVLFDLDRGVVDAAVLIPKTARGIEEFFAEQLQKTR
jgi:hypothetical protein